MMNVASPARAARVRRPDVAERRCLVTRQAHDRDRLIRFVVDPAGRVLPDLEERLPGRGMWLSAERDVLNKARARGVFAKAARAPVQVAPDLADQVERLLAKRMMDGLGLARRAGQVALGFDQVRQALRSSSAALLVAAADGAADGRAKLRRLAPDLPLIGGLSRAELGAALGRESLVHVAVGPGGLARRLLRDAARLAGFRRDALELPAAMVPPDRIESRESTELQ
jgi:predicted RNA-binding protein YlxR (DUF448 family)